MSFEREIERGIELFPRALIRVSIPLLLMEEEEEEAKGNWPKIYVYALNTRNAYNVIYSYL